jgi:hypothetical protein
MSAVRMCDNCGRIFSENEDGWATAVVQQSKRRPDGGVRLSSVQQDACPACNPAGRPVEMRPRIDMGTQPTIPAAQLPAPVVTPGNVDYGEIARLEHELGMDNKPGS